MINNIRPLDDFFTYMENTINGLLKNGLITKVVVAQATLDFGESSPINEIADEYDERNIPLS